MQQEGLYDTRVPRGLRPLAMFVDWYPFTVAVGAVVSVAGLIALVLAAERAAGLAVYDPALGGDPFWLQAEQSARAPWPLLRPLMIYTLANIAVGSLTGRTLGMRVAGLPPAPSRWGWVTRSFTYAQHTLVPPTLDARRRARWFAFSLAVSVPLSCIAGRLVQEMWGSGMSETPVAFWAVVSGGTAVLQALTAVALRVRRRATPLAALPVLAALLPPGVLALTLSDPSRAWPQALCLLAEMTTLLLLIRGRVRLDQTPPVGATGGA